jgi:hypothetical protein
MSDGLSVAIGPQVVSVTQLDSWKGKIHHVGVTSVEDPTLGSSLFVTLRKVLFPQAIQTSCPPDKSKELDHRAS